MSSYSDVSVDLVINRLSRAVYDQLCADGEIKSNQIYLVDDPNFDVFGKKLVNVGMPSLTGTYEGVNVGFLDAYYLKKNGVSAVVDNTRILSGDGSKSLGGDLSISYRTVSPTWQVTVKEGSIDPANVSVVWDPNPGSGNGWNFVINGLKVPTGNTDQNALQLQIVTTVADETVILAAEKPITWTPYDRVVADSELSTRFYEKSETSSATELKDKFDTLSTYSEIHSELSNDGYLVEHQSLSDYYKKSETSNDVELADEFSKKASKTEVSDLSDAISADIKNLADNYVKKVDINVNYDSEAKKIYLSAGDHVTYVETDDFIKDGMISSVTYDEETHILRIVWNTDAGGKTTDINLSGLIDTYYAGYGLDLENGTFSIDDEVVAQLSDFNDYWKKSETSSKVELDAKFATLSTYSEISAQLSNDGYASESWVEAQGYLTAHQSLSDYYTKTQTSSDTQLTTEFAKYAKPSDIKNGKLTIQKNGVEIATFTANQENDVSANIIADTPVWGNITGELTAQTDLNTALGLKADKTELDVLSDYVKLAADKQEINGAINVTAGLSVGGSELTSIIDAQLPKKTSDLTNDSDFATSAYVDQKTETAYPAAGVSSLTKAGDVADFVNSSINAFAAYYITKDIAGHSFATHAELLAATILYSGGAARVPIKNDYAIVAEDEDHTTALSVDPTTRYVYMGEKDTPYDSSKWSFQYIVNNTALTQSQINAINSGITAAKVADIDVAVAKAEAVEAKVNPANQTVTPFSGYYNCYDTKLNALGQVVDGAKICLKDYSFSKGYAIKFSTPENQEVHLQFYKDEGSGPVIMTGSINEKYSFPMNQSYVIEVKFEYIDVKTDGWTGNRQKMTFRTIEWSDED